MKTYGLYALYTDGDGYLHHNLKTLHATPTGARKAARGELKLLAFDTFSATKRENLRNRIDWCGGNYGFVREMEILP